MGPSLAQSMCDNDRNLVLTIGMDNDLMEYSIAYELTLGEAIVKRNNLIFWSDKVIMYSADHV